MKPWEIHAALTDERLRVVGRLAWDARVSAADDAKRDLGDNLWDIGCKAYSRTCYSISRVAADGDHPYLSVRDNSKHFVFSIGGVPIRVYRGDIEAEAPDRYAIPDEQELNDLQYACDLYDTPTPSAIFRIAVATDAGGFPITIHLVQVESDGTIRNPWHIDLSGDGPVGIIPDPFTPPPADVRDERAEKAREDAAVEANNNAEDMKGA